MPLPKLSGVIQIDEKYIREGQKGQDISYLTSIKNQKEIQDIIYIALSVEYLVRNLSMSFVPLTVMETIGPSVPVWDP